MTENLPFSFNFFENAHKLQKLKAQRKKKKKLKALDKYCPVSVGTTKNQIYV